MRRIVGLMKLQIYFSALKEHLCHNWCFIGVISWSYQNTKLNFIFIAIAALSSSDCQCNWLTSQLTSRRNCNKDIYAWVFLGNSSVFGGEGTAWEAFPPWTLDFKLILINGTRKDLVAHLSSWEVMKSENFSVHGA